MDVFHGIQTDIRIGVSIKRNCCIVLCWAYILEAIWSGLSIYFKSYNAICGYTLYDFIWTGPATHVFARGRSV